MLRPEEVEILVCGSHKIDLRELQKNTEYDGYKATDRLIRWMSRWLSFDFTWCLVRAMWLSSYLFSVSNFLSVPCHLHEICMRSSADCTVLLANCRPRHISIEQYRRVRCHVTRICFNYLAGRQAKFPNFGVATIFFFHRVRWPCKMRMSYSCVSLFVVGPFLFRFQENSGRCCLTCPLKCKSDSYASSPEGTACPLAACLKWISKSPACVTDPSTYQRPTLASISWFCPNIPTRTRCTRSSSLPCPTPKDLAWNSRCSINDGTHPHIYLLLTRPVAIFKVIPHWACSPWPWQPSWLIYWPIAALPTVRLR